MKKLLILVVVLSVSANICLQAQCYEPNLRKADAEYANGNYSQAYEYYSRATKCPDASRFENGKAAKAGKNKCFASLKVDGRKSLTITVGREAGRRTFKIAASRLDKDSWNAYEYSPFCEIVEKDKANNTITIKWDENKFVGTREFYVTIYGNGVNHVDAVINFKQEGYPDEVVVRKTGEEYDTVIKGSGDISFVLLRGKYGFVDSDGDAITPIKYTFKKTNESLLEEYSWEVNTMLLRVYNNEKYGFINRQGNEIVPVIYDYIEESKLNWGVSTTVVKREGKYGLLNGAGQEIVPCKYDGYVGGYKDEPVAFRKGEKYALFDQDGKQLTEFKYDNISKRYSNTNQLFSGYSRLCVVYVNGKYGYVNMNGQEIITPRYKYAEHFNDNRAVVGNGTKYGFINLKGELVIPYKYDYSSGHFLSGGVGCVRNNDGEYMFVDSLGHELSTKRYKSQRSWCDSWHEMSKTGSDTVYVYYGMIENNKIVWTIEDTTEMISLASRGIQKAKLDLAYFYNRRWNKESSYKWAVEAAKDGNGDSKTFLAKKYYFGDGCTKDFENAFGWFEKAVEMGNAEAMGFVAKMLWMGQGCTGNQYAARNMLKRALRAGNGHIAEEMISLGMDMSEIKPY